MSRTMSALLLLLVLPVGGALGASGRTGPARTEAYYEAPTQAVTPADLSGPWGVVTAVDAWRGVPTFLWATPLPAPVVPPGGTLAVEAIARRHLGRLAFLYHLDAAALATVSVHRTLATGRGGTLVTFRQRVGSLPVVDNELKVLLAGDGALVAVAGRLHPAARGAAPRSAYAWTAEEALAEALADRLEGSLSPAALVPVGAPREGYQRYAIAGTGPGAWALLRPARIRPVLYPLPSRLVPAYEAEFLAQDPVRGGPQAWRVVLSAVDGQVLQRRSLTFNATYRVWAAPDGLHVPADGPLSDVAPHPTGAPDGYRPEWTAPILVDLDGFNSGAGGDPDPWLAPDETRTFGNNARVYVDLASPDGYGAGDLWGATSSPGSFDYVYDASALPYASTDQLHAAAAQVFYTVNWLHDYFYDSGFDEAAGNAQVDNYGRGGLEGDPLIAQVEGKPDGFQNNASMSALGDGQSPFMLNGLWQASPALYVEGERIRARGAFFGPATFDVSGPLVLMQDGAAPASDGCSAPTVDLTGAIVLIDRGTCTFASKAERAQGAGALAVIIANNQAGESAQEMPNEDPPLTITIPSVSISREDGQTLKGQLQAGPVSATLSRDPEVRQGGLDSGVVAHEWGHYFHMRLVPCGNAQCGAMSEGFGDFVAGYMTIREGDDPQGTYATGVYSVWHLPDGAYFGIRRVPYSADLSKNALSFRHVADGEPLPDTHPLDANTVANSEVHNAGEIWGTVMHDLYMALLGDTLGPAPRLTFVEAQRRMADLLVAGMALAPQNPTFTEQRDALLAVAATHDPADFALLAVAFARRGLGTCAQSPARDSEDFTDLTESFLLAPNLRVDGVTFDDDGTSCDDDGILDAGEVGRVVITLQNTGAAPLAGATAAVTSPSGDVTFPGGGVATFGTIAPFALGTATVEIAVGAGVTAPTALEVEVTVSHGETCLPQVVQTTIGRIHYDEVVAASATDDVESDRPVWTAGGTRLGAWERLEQGGQADNHLWHVDDLESFSDVWLASPPLEVSATAPFRITFRHRHRFEQGNGTNWDGAVVELSRDDGATWEDLGDYADPGYGGALTDQSGNPLANRDAYVGDSPGYPGWDTVSLDLGTALAGETVRMRFRFGSDQAAGEYGWDLDDLAFEGLVNTPFPRVTENARGCEQPFADAGPDQTVAPGTFVTLDGEGSSDPQGDPLTFQWTQRLGASVTLADADTATPSFTAPMVEDATALVFELVVSDGAHEDRDEVTITVDPTVSGDGGVGPDGGGSRLTPGRGCGCRTGGAGGGEALVFGLLLGLGLVCRRQRQRQRRR